WGCENEVAIRSRSLFTWAESRSACLSPTAIRAPCRHRSDPYTATPNQNNAKSRLSRWLKGFTGSGSILWGLRHLVRPSPVTQPVLGLLELLPVPEGARED